jgi:undecaprenyl phosphate-alpha-L-ara4FN deformylase
MSKPLGLRVDVDFGVGLRKGVPYLLDAFRARQLRATFYVAMGPDGFRKHTQRLGSASYRSRVRRMRPWAIVRTFGPAYLLRRAIGICDDVGRRYPAVIRAALELGHEVGVHGYDHYWWAENVFAVDRAALRNDMAHAFAAFRECTGRVAAAWAAPNWRCSPDSLELLDEYHLTYGADTRGRTPFIPAFAGHRASTPQLPISLPCLHEIADYLDTVDARIIAAEFARHLVPDYNVWCIHDYYEGLLRRDLFERVLDHLLDNGWSVMAIDSLAGQLNREALPICEVIQGRVPGGRGLVSCQGPAFARAAAR